MKNYEEIMMKLWWNYDKIMKNYEDIMKKCTDSTLFQVTPIQGNLEYSCFLILISEWNKKYHK